MPDIPSTELIICTTCRPDGAPRELPPAGQALFEAVRTLHDGERSAGLQVRGVACLSVCNRSCTVALQAPGKPSYLFGDLTAEAETAAQLLACARLHAQRADGELPRSERPPRLHRGIVAKLPPCLPAAVA